MVDYTFRLRFNIPESVALEVLETNIDLSGPHHPSLTLSADQKDKPIKEAKRLVLKGSGHPNEMEAITSGEKFRDALTLAFAYCRMGANFGDREGRGGFTNIGLRMLEQQSGLRIINEVHGLMAYETHPPPMLAMADQPTLSLCTAAKKFTSAFTHAASSGYLLNEQERLSFSLFSFSFFERSQDARLLFLVMSVEVLLNPQSRSLKVIEHVESLINLTENAHDLPQSERDSLIGSLSWLKRESIRQASRRLINEKLGGNTYKNPPASDFFLDCYDLRSKLVHGSQSYPTKEVVSNAAANLEVLVADLLANRINWD